MIIGVPKEIKDNENRIGITPAGVDLLVQGGHKVLVQKDGGLGSGITNEDYAHAGAEIVEDPKDVWAKAEMIIKVKEPQPSEYELIQEHHIIFTYFHFAASLELTKAMMERKAKCVAYETVKNDKGELPLLTPMSEIAGRLAIQAGAQYLEKPHGRGILLPGVPGVAPAKVVVIGGGTVGSNAALIAAGMGAQVVILDINVERLRYLDHIMPKNVITILSDPYRIRENLRDADLVVGAVLITGARAPILVPRSYLKDMKKGSVIVDVAVDQGGCIETCRPTSISDPIFVVDDVVHYCVANMPGAVPYTSTRALTNVTIPYARKIADLGLEKAVREVPELAPGVNMVSGKITHKGVADSFNLEYTPLEEVLS
ncbi:MAG: alanine dehydrogenase [Planctomycetota bacterium]|nr:MAG: alanine dehydrogenase [Planctomycetota bacterium]